MKFSLVMATLGRSEEIKIFLDSLSAQDYKNFELIIVDQNERDILRNIVDEYKQKFYINHIRIKEKGLSLARNIGIKYVTGDIIAFPDDDCAYSEGILTFINNFFNQNSNIDFVTFKLRDKDSGVDSNLKWYNYDVEITYQNIFRTVISPSIFIKFKNIDDVFFDENLGVGRKFGSGEESDMALELLYRGYIGKYLTNFIIYHPNKKEPMEKIYSYGLGYGAIIKKHVKLRNGKYFVLNYLFKDSILKSLAGMFVNVFKFNYYGVNSYKKRMISRVKGYLEYKIN